VVPGVHPSVTEGVLGCVVQVVTSFLRKRKDQRGHLRVYSDAAADGSDLKQAIASRYCLSPLLMHSFCMQHQVIWCTQSVAVDNRVQGMTNDILHKAWCGDLSTARTSSRPSPAGE
jgi:hypothetical protein